MPAVSPSQRPWIYDDGRLYAPLAGGIPAYMTHTRASDGWLRQLNDVNGERWTPVGGNDLPRFSRPLGDSIVGLLVEQAGQNECLRSRAIFTAPWAVSAGTPVPTADARVSPDGNSNADDIEDDNAGASPAEAYEQDIATFGAVPVTVSVFARLLAGAGGGLITREAVGGTYQTVAHTSPTWARVSATRTLTGTLRIVLAPATAGAFPANESLVGKASYSLVQAEARSHPSSPMPADAAPVARSSDEPRVLFANLGHVITPTRGRVSLRWRPGFAQNESAVVGVTQVQLSGAPNTLIRFLSATQKIQLLVNNAVVAETAALTFGRWTSEFFVDWKWDAGRTQVFVVQDGVVRLDAGAAWVVPSFALGYFTLGTADSGAGQDTGIFYDFVLG